MNIYYFENRKNNTMEKLVKKQRELIAGLKRTIELDDGIIKRYKNIVKMQEDTISRCRKMIDDLKQIIDAAE